MIQAKMLLRATFSGAIALVPAACAQPSSQSGMQGMSGMQGQSTAATQGHNMPGMDMQTMMNQCADMRRQMAQGTHQNTPDMNQMMTQCDAMDHSMGSMPSMGSTAPAATRSR